MTKTDASRVHFLYATRWVGVLLGVLWVGFAGFSSHQASAATSKTINFQARLMQSSGAIVPDGTYNVEFKLYNALTSSGSSQGSCTGDAACLWTETRTSSNRISVVNGYLTAELGSVTALPSIDWSQNLYLTMNIGGTGTPGWDGEMSPRLHLTAVPHAFTADQLSNTNGSFTSTLGFTAPTASRSILLPDEAGTLCIQSSTNCGFAASTGSTNYIQNQNASDQTANFRISGSGQAATSFLAPLFDTATAATLNVGSTATAINLNKSTTITGGITQSGGTISLTGNAASSITTSTGALTLTAAGTSNWTVGGTNQSLTVTTSGTGTLTLGTTGAGTVTIGTSSQTINIGSTNNTRAVHIADGGTSTNQVVTIGSTNTGSTTTIQGGTSSTAIALTTGTNGKINLTSAGTGGVVSTLGSGGFTIVSSTNSTTALAIQDSSSNYIFSVNTSSGIVIMGAIQATYSGLDGTLNAPLGALTLGRTGGATTILGSSASTIQATSGSFTTTLSFTAPTANRSIVIPDEAGTLCMRSSTNCGFAPTSGSANYIQNGTTAQSANMYVQAATSGSVAATLRANAAGTGDILDLKNGAGTNVAAFSSTGSALFKTSTDSTTALQVQSNGGTTALNVDTTNARVGIGGIVAPAVSLDVEGAVQQTGLTTSNTSSTDVNKWTLLGTCTITAQFRQCIASINILGGHDGNTGDNGQATVSMRVKQQNALAGAPYVNVTMNGTAELITKNDIVAVTTQNDATATVVQVYGRITNAFEQWYYTPVMNTDQSPSKFVWSQSAGFLAALPAGTQTATVYGDAYANTLTVQNAANSTSAFQIQNAVGTSNLFIADTTNTRIAIAKATAAYTLDVGGDINTTTALRIAGTSVCDTTGGTGCIAKSGSGFYIHNDTALQTTANFNISGTGIAATALQAPILDASSATTLSIGTVNATGVNIATNNAAHTINIGTGGTSTVQAVTVGSTFGGSSTLIQGGTGTSAISLAPASGGNIKLTTAGSGSINLTPGNSGVFIQPTTDSTAAFQVISNGSGNSVIRVDTTNERVGIGVISDPIGAKLSIATSSTVALRAYQGGASDSFQLGNATDDFLTIGSTGNFLMKPTTNSANAFRIQNSGGAATLFTVDTSGNNILIGSTTTNSTAITLTLDSSSATTDPSTSGTGGAMYYSTAYNAMRCYQDSAWANCNDPTRMSHGYTIQEDFIASTSAGSNYTCGSGTMGATYAWACNNTGTATAITPVAADLYTRPGQLQISTGSTATGISSMYLAGGTSQAFFIGGGESYETAVNIPTLSNGTQTYVFRVGLCDNNSHGGTCSNGVYFEYSSAASTSWVGKVTKGGTLVSTSTTKTVATGWTNLRFVATSANSVTFYVKGPGESTWTSLGAIGSSSSVPNAAANATTLMFSLDKSVGTTASTVKVDYVDYWNDFQGYR